MQTVDRSQILMRSQQDIYSRQQHDPFLTPPDRCLDCKLRKYCYSDYFRPTFHESWTPIDHGDNQEGACSVSAPEIKPYAPAQLQTFGKLARGLISLGMQHCS